jgi:hypothetical protein
MGAFDEGVIQTSLPADGAIERALRERRLRPAGAAALARLPARLRRANRRGRRSCEDPLLIEVVNLGLRRSSEPEEPVLPVPGRIGPPLIR